MRKAFGLGLILLAAACGQAPNRGGDGVTATRSGGNAAADEDLAAPGVAPTAAPGVAFNYKYAFRLPAERIAGIQEQHALACEKLGLARCRITGMYYHLTGDRDIEARLDFKLDPAIARAFGKQGIDAVNHADGLLVESEINGEEEQSAIDAARRDEADSGERLKKIEAQLARSDLRSAERAELQSQAQQLRDAMAGSRAVRTEKQALLATTPMSFNYQSGDMAPGVRRSLTQGFDNLVGALEWMLLALITLAPWLVVAILAWLGWRRFRPRPTEAAAA
ncbi:MAG: hypothetical protein QOK17_1843 [Sphingomonadales bacterium]|jgi:hypothetical protein|nr:hypothetical protein [Sphingomonadales bacterium]